MSYTVSKAKACGFHHWMKPTTGETTTVRSVGRDPEFEVRRHTTVAADEPRYLGWGQHWHGPHPHRTMRVGTPV